MTPNKDIDHEEIPEFRVVPGDEREEHGHQVGSQMPRRIKMTKEIMNKYSMTPQCPGCINLRLGRYHRPHLESCRKRIEDFLRQDVELKYRVEAATARQDAWASREETQGTREGTQETLGEILDPMEGRDVAVHAPPLMDAEMGGRQWYTSRMSMCKITMLSLLKTTMLQSSMKI